MEILGRRVEGGVPAGGYIEGMWKEPSWREGTNIFHDALWDGKVELEEIDAKTSWRPRLWLRVE